MLSAKNYRYFKMPLFPETFRYSTLKLLIRKRKGGRGEEGGCEEDSSFLERSSCMSHVGPGAQPGGAPT